MAERPVARPRRRRFTRRGVLIGAVGALVGARWGLPWWWAPGPRRPLQGEAADFLAEKLGDVDRAALWDVHAHLVGLGRGDSGCAVHPDFLSHAHPIKRFIYELYSGAARIDDGPSADADFLAELLRLHREANPQGRLMLLAYDRFVDEDGREVPERSQFHTPNDYVLGLAADHADVEAIVSIHPYRRDAVARLDRAVEAGARACKWLPNAQGIDPASPLCDRFYGRLAASGLPLLTHAGTEHAVDAADLQALGNPLRLRRALDAGVTVIVAHCGTLGSNVDLDAAGASAAGAVEAVEAKNVDLFLRMMGESQYEGRLFGDISALTFVNRTGRPLRAILGATEIHHRLVNGSDYPLVAVDPVLSTRVLQARGFLTSEERRLCNLVFAANPLAFDYVVKRCVKLETPTGTARFAPEVFETARLFT